MHGYIYQCTVLFLQQQIYKKKILNSKALSQTKSTKVWLIMSRQQRTKREKLNILQSKVGENRSEEFFYYYCKK